VRRPVLVGAALVAVIALIAAIAGIAVAAIGGSDKSRASPSGSGGAVNPTKGGGGIVAPSGSLEGLSGSWRVSTSNARILVHTGDFANATLSFRDGNIRADYGTAAHYTTMTKGVITLQCSRSCFAIPSGVGSPSLSIRNGKLANREDDGGPCKLKPPTGLTDVRYNGSLDDPSSITSIRYATPYPDWSSDCSSVFLGAFDVSLTRVS
jgi:hypothetical protein